MVFALQKLDGYQWLVKASELKAYAQHLGICAYPIRRKYCNLGL